MKPFITDAFRDGRFFLEYQIENATGLSVHDVFVGSSIRCISVPVGHSFTEAWILRLALDNGKYADFSSACTDTGNWREIGSLNIRIFIDPEAETPSLSFESREVAGFKIVHADRLVYEEAALYVENGIVFTSEIGEEIWIAAGVAPGSVSVRAPHFENEFRPELAAQDCKRLLLV